LFYKKKVSLKNLFLQQRYRRDRFPSHDRDMSVERPDLDDDKTMMNMHKEQRKRESRDRRIRDHDDREHDLDNSQRFPDKKKSVKKAEAYGLSSDLASHDDKDALKSKLSYSVIITFWNFTVTLVCL
jgi:paired amphipathic helix protein Sin3a